MPEIADIRRPLIGTMKEQVNTTISEKKIRILLTVNIVRLDASHRPAPKAFCVKLHPVYTQNLDLVGCGEDSLQAIQKLAVDSTLARTS